MTINNLVNLQQHLLFDAMVGDPVGRPGKGVDKEIQGRRPKSVKIDHQGFAGINVGMLLEHLPDLLNNGLNLINIIIPQPNRFIDTAIQHARRIFQRNGGEDRVGNIKRSLIKGTDNSQSPAYLLDSALYLPVRAANPVTHRKRPVQVNHQTTEEICQQIFGSKTYRYTTNSAKR